MTTDVKESDEKKIFVGEENDAELNEQKDYGATFDTFDEDKARKITIW